MDLNEEAIHSVIHPTAAFSSPPGYKSLADSELPILQSWQDSSLNPKNRIDSLDFHERPQWRIDGCTGLGSQYYAVPLFVESIRPVRMDVFIPEPSTLPLDLRYDLDLDDAFHTRDPARVLRLGITRHLLRILQYWTSKMSDPQKIYSNMPFGSRIVLQNLPKNIDMAQIIIVPTHHLERQLLSVSTLRKLWKSDVDLPSTVDLDDTEYISQLHDSVCLVRFDDKVWIFKALTSYTKYLYHELRQLLIIPAHRNIVARPVHLVTKKCGFGGKKAVVGFVLEYHPHGSLRDLLPFLRIHDMVSIADETKWALQLASALIHLRETTGIFYPDLRLDNIVLSNSQDVVMVDFEQRGVWCEFAAPEVNAIEYIRLLAVDEEIPTHIRDKYATILTDMLPGWEAMGQGEEYSWPSVGYNVPWACLTQTEQEACEVYMLGRVLWCIFEGASAPQRAAAWLSYRWEPLVEFPGYTHTPEPMRDLIDHCTQGRRTGLSKLIVRERNHLVLRELERTGRSTTDEVQQTGRGWWRREIEASDDWLARRKEGMGEGCWNENYYNRPSLRDVHTAIQDFRQQQGFSLTPDLSNGTTRL